MAGDDGFSGLEAAIVLIAFIVVAGVFSFAVLGAGFSSSSKAKEVALDGGRSPTAVMVMGSVVGRVDDNSNYIEILFFSCEAIGEPVPVSAIRFSLLTPARIYEIPSSAATLSWHTEIEQDGLLSEGEILKVEVLPDTGLLTADIPFTLIIHPPWGVPVNVRCQAPPALARKNYYEVGFG